MNIKKILALVSVLAVSSTLVTAVFAAPAGIPPNGTVDAKFSSVATATIKDATGVSLFGLFSNSITAYFQATFPSLIVTGVSDFKGSITNSVAGASGKVTLSDADGVVMNGLMVDTNSYIHTGGSWLSDMKALRISDADGVDVWGDISNSSTSGGVGNPVSIGDANGVKMSGLLFQNNTINTLSLLPVSFGSKVDLGGGITNRTTQQPGSINMPVKIMDDAGLEIANDAGTTGLKILADGTISQNVVGKPVSIVDVDGLKITGAGGNNVDLGSTTAAIDATGIVKNAGLTIAANGDISDTSGVINFNDAQGIQVSNGTGVMSAYIDGAGQFFTNNNISASSISAAVEINTDGNIKVSNGGSITVGTGNITLDSGNLTVTAGRIKAAGGVGHIYTNEITYVNPGSTPVNTFSTKYSLGLNVSCTDPSKDRVLGCGLRHIGSGDIAEKGREFITAIGSAGASSCTVYARNMSSPLAAQTMKAYVTCLDPDSSVTW